MEAGNPCLPANFIIPPSPTTYGCHFRLVSICRVRRCCNCFARWGLSLSRISPKRQLVLCTCLRLIPLRFGLDGLKCDRCGGRVGIFWTNNPLEAIKKILDCFGLPSSPPQISPAVLARSHNLQDIFGSHSRLKSAGKGDAFTIIHSLVQPAEKSHSIIQGSVLAG